MRKIEIDKCPNPRGECDSREAYTTGRLAYCVKCMWHFRIDNEKTRKRQDDQKRWKANYVIKHSIKVPCPAKDLNPGCKGEFLSTPLSKKKFCCSSCRKIWYSVHGYNKKPQTVAGDNQVAAGIA